MIIWLLSNVFILIYIDNKNKFNIYIYSIMIQSKLDIIIIILFVITLSILFGLSVVNIIDKKISNVSVNIPPIKVPKQSVTIKLKCVNEKQIDSYYIKEEKEENNTNDDNNTNNTNNINIENFGNVKKIENYDNVSIDTIDNIDKEIKEEISETMYEPNVGKIQKEQKIEFVKCSNKKEKINSPIKKKVSRIGPYKMYASNYSNYNSYVSPYDINRTIVPRSDEKIKKGLIPKGSNYSFSNSPALKRDLN